MPGRQPPSGTATQVSTLELFVDLVFVFTITQIATYLEHDLSWAGAGRALLMFSLLWWMYGGYIWLANQVPPRRNLYRLLLLTGMAGFMITAVAVPHAFDGTGLLFGLGYLIVVAVHSGLFTQAAQHRGLGWLVALNLVPAALLLAAGLLDPGRVVYGLWVLAVAVLVVIPRLRRTPRFDLNAAHFVERHGLLVIITLGETVVATGASIDAAHVTPGLVAGLLLGLALPAALWWSYFSGDDDAATEALGRVDPARRVILAIRAYFYAHIAVLLGIVVTTAGLREVVAHPFARLGPAAALALAGGVALYFAGDASFRRVMGIRPVLPRSALAVLAPASWLLGRWTTGAVQVAVLIALIVAALVVERHRADAAAAPPG